ncbi:Putative sensory transduction regulator [Thermus arciformis]|uniref:Putative sensory transduction regulator n=1 Tax=Thermus arciformis TaxID=482827 RepID=A0A1G7LQV9_9DEIN|nr:MULTISPECIES: YbjN domain-containing protein [Thermus]SDF51902.1 Putative sensory transduction regulator [Thermus arciformis]
MRWLLALGLLFLAPALAQGGVRTSITVGEMEALLKAWGFRHEREDGKEGPYFVVYFGDLKATLLLLRCEGDRCLALLLGGSFTGFAPEKRPDHARINEWNREKLFSRAYLDEDGDPVVEADLDLEGGVTDGAIREFLETFRETLEAFADWIGF